MSEPLISVIVPVYNVERYIKRCVDSILAQTYTNLEIILVDDGSTDCSGEICDVYAKENMRVKTIHQKNGGLSSARNTGICHANGIYYAFVDSDDYIAIDYIAYLYRLLQENQAQIAICGYKKVLENDAKIKENLDPKVNTVNAYHSEEALFQLLYQRKMITSACGRLFRSELFEKIRFPEKKLHEDVAVMYRLFDASEKIVCTNAEKYYYFQRGDSIVNKGFHRQRMAYLEFTKECIQYMELNHPQLIKAAISRHFSACFDLLSCIGNNKKEFAKEYMQIVCEIKKYRKTVLFDSNARLKNRLAAAGSYVSITAMQRLSCLLKRP